MSKSEKKKKNREDSEYKWYKLDNAANIYPALISRTWSPNFRISATLKEEINPELLQRAVENCLPRFDNFSSSLKKGLFWHYLEHNENAPVIEKDSHHPIRVINGRFNNGYSFRICYYDRRIALEVMHVLTDGTGGALFLRTVVAEYLRLTGKSIPYSGEGIVDITSKPQPEEMEDSFRKYARFKTRQTRKESSAYHVEGTKMPTGQVGVIIGRIPVEALSKKAKEYGATITELLASVLIWVMYQHQKKEGSREIPVKVSVPVNLRNFYPSHTMRNFSLFINPGIEPRYGDYSFEEIVSDVHHFMRMNLKEKYLNAVMSANLADELNPAIRAVPLFLKLPVLYCFYMFAGETRYSTCMSNMGVMKVPEEMAQYIERFDFLLGRPYAIPTNLGVVSFNGMVSIGFTRSVTDPYTEREFFRCLVKMGIPVKIESNQ